MSFHTIYTASGVLQGEIKIVDKFSQIDKLDNYIEYFLFKEIIGINENHR